MHTYRLLNRATLPGQWRADGNMVDADEKPLCLQGKNGGGGGSRTRVRRSSFKGLYMRVRSLKFRTRCRRAAETTGY